MDGLLTRQVFSGRFWLLIGLNFFFIICDCGYRPGTDVLVDPPGFKVKVPFEADWAGIFIDTYWGKDKRRHRLLWDNHSPTWANDTVIQGSVSISKSKDFAYRTTTADCLMSIIEELSPGMDR